MEKYPSIQNLYKRDSSNQLIPGQYSRPVFEYLMFNSWMWTEKLDGTNMRIIWTGDRVEIRGRTDDANLRPSLLAAITINSEELFSVFGDRPACLYGEGVGAGIQKGGGRYGSAPSFHLFDVKIGDFWLEWDAVKEIAAKLGIPSVPDVGVRTLASAIADIETGVRSVFFDGLCEGIVGKPLVSLFAKTRERVIVKLKHEDLKRRG